jgi:hypothetical protein
MTFAEFFASQEEGLLLPDRRGTNGVSRINATPLSDDRRRRMRIKLPKPPPNPYKPIKPTIMKVPQIVAPNFVKLPKPVKPVPPLSKPTRRTDK